VDIAVSLIGLMGTRDDILRNFLVSPTWMCRSQWDSCGPLSFCCSLCSLLLTLASKGRNASPPRILYMFPFPSATSPPLHLHLFFLSLLLHHLFTHFFRLSVQFRFLPLFFLFFAVQDLVHFFQQFCLFWTCWLLASYQLKNH